MKTYPLHLPNPDNVLTEEGLSLIYRDGICVDVRVVMVWIDPDTNPFPWEQEENDLKWDLTCSFGEHRTPGERFRAWEDHHDIKGLVPLP